MRTGDLSGTSQADKNVKRQQSEVKACPAEAVIRAKVGRQEHEAGSGDHHGPGLGRKAWEEAAENKDQAEGGGRTAGLPKSRQSWASPRGAPCGAPEGHGQAVSEAAPGALNITGLSVWEPPRTHM